MSQPSHNARSVVENWQNSGPEIQKQWGFAAVLSTPSKLNLVASRAYASVQYAADAAANHLREAGFMPSHPTLTRLRGIASDAAHEANRLAAWSADLATAEANLPVTASTASPQASQTPNPPTDSPNTQETK